MCRKPEKNCMHIVASPSDACISCSRLLHRGIDVNAGDFQHLSIPHVCAFISRGKKRHKGSTGCTKLVYMGPVSKITGNSPP